MVRISGVVSFVRSIILLGEIAGRSLMNEPGTFIERSFEIVAREQRGRRRGEGIVVSYECRRIWNKGMRHEL